MTSEMAFECLFVSSDPELFRIIAGILRELSVSIDVCLRASKAFDMLQKGNADLVVIDWEGADSSELVQQIWQDHRSKKPTLVAISSSDTPLPGAHIMVRKPITLDSGVKPFKAAYQRMLMDYRKHVRHALMLPVSATTEDGKEVAVTVTDIGDGGVGLSGRENLTVGEVLTFRLLLPGAPREVLVHVRVLWTRDYGRMGCEYVRIPPVDLLILHDWLKAKGQVKRPRMAI